MIFTLEPAPPFRLDLTVWALRRRPANGIDRWDGETYRRMLVIEGRPVEVAVVQHGDRLEIRAERKRGAVAAALRRMLGLDVDLQPFYALAERDPALDRIAQRFRGMKPPRFPTVWEGLANAVTCQQISLSAGMVVLSRLAAPFGYFPSQREVAALTAEDLRALGYSFAKARALREAEDADLERLAGMTDEDAVAYLTAMRGVGRWTAEYVLLRGLGRTHIFPGDDLGARGNLERWLELRHALDYEGVRRVLRKWWPYGGLVYFHVLLESIASAGYIAVER